MWWVGKFLWVMRLCALFILLLILPAPDRVCTSRRTAHIRQCWHYIGIWRGLGHDYRQRVVVSLAVKRLVPPMPFTGAGACLSGNAES